MFNRNTYEKRRKELKKIVGEKFIIIPGNSESPMSYKDNCYNFIQDSTFSYYFGLNSPDLVGVIDVINDKEYIFGREFTIDDIVWMGQQKTFKERSLEVGIENFLEKEELKEIIKNIDRKDIVFTNQYRLENIIFLSELLGENYNTINTNFSEELVRAIVSMRNIKTDEEIVEMERATNVTREMHLEAMRVAKKGMKEFEVVSALEAVAKRHNATMSFHTICTVSGQTLHNHYHGNELKDGDLLLVDCGARLENGYCGDMTTVFPVSGKFNDVQKDFYSLLIKMFEKAEEITKAGITNKEVHLEVCKVLAQGMVDRGLLKGDIDEIVKSGAHALFFPHGLGHMIGMDVHDMENFGEKIVGYTEDIERSTQFGLKSLRLGRELKEGFVITIEPGIYFIPELIKKWKDSNMHLDFINYDEVEKYIGLSGMRYEGDFLITKDGNRRLGEKMPKYFNEIEECRG